MTETVEVDIRPGIAAILLDDNGRLLLHRRRVGGGWAPVSGHVEAGETLVGALHREVREETGLEVRIERFVSMNSDPAFQTVTYPDGRRVQFVTALFECRITGGSFHGSSEGLDWEWFAHDALPSPLLPYAEVWLEDARAARPTPIVR